MKYILGVLGLLVGCTYVWATPETMTMYATLSEPIGSFWAVKTEGTDPVTLPAKSQLNLGVVANATIGSSGGTIQLVQKTPPDSNKPVLTIEELRMEQGTTFEIGNKWFVDTINIGNAGTAQFDGILLVNQLKLSDIVDNLSEGEILRINVNYLRLGNKIDTTVAQFTEIDSPFKFKSAAVPVASVTSRYNGEPSADWWPTGLHAPTNASN